VESPFRTDGNREDKPKAPCCKNTATGRVDKQFVCRFLHPDYTVGLGVSPSQHPIGVVAGYTAGGELHPALKRTFWHTV